jgi:hypothetical protein
VADFVSAGLAVPGVAAEPTKCFEEKRFDIMGLEATGFRALHVFSNAGYPTGVHGIVGERPFLQEVLQLSAVDAVFDGSGKPGAYLRHVAVADGLDEQLAEWFAFKLQFAEDVEHLAAKRLARFLQFFQEAAIYVALAGFSGDKVPQVADFRLADTVDAAKSLFEPVGIPGEVVVYHQVCPLEVDAFAGSIGGEKDLNFGVVKEAFLGLAPFLAAHPAMDHDESLRPA